MKVLGWMWAALTAALLARGFYVAMFVTPTEATMGDVQRIFYYHFPSAILGLALPMANLVASLVYLASRRRAPARADKADAFAVATAEVTLLFVSIGLLTGILWARPVWGIWWTWDERLTTYLLLWLIYVSYVLLRRFSANGDSSSLSQQKTLAAALSIFAGADVPIVYMSIRWWRTQHPAPVFGGGDNSGIDPSMWPAVWLNVGGWAAWAILMVGLRYALEKRQLKARRERAAEALDAFSPAQ